MLLNKVSVNQYFLHVAIELITTCPHFKETPFCYILFIWPSTITKVHLDMNMVEVIVWYDIVWLVSIESDLWQESHMGFSNNLCNVNEPFLYKYLKAFVRQNQKGSSLWRWDLT